MKQVVSYKAKIIDNRLRKAQKLGGRKATNKKLWAKINNINDELVNKVVLSIVTFAKDNDCQTIVFEHLNFKGKRPRKIAALAQTWHIRKGYPQSSFKWATYKYCMRLEHDCPGI